jgi:monoamine oxidase
MMNRRELLVSGAAFGAVSLARPVNRAFATDCDVIVVGAGAAGIVAARELRALGKSVLVLEARARVGGRLHTEQGLGAPYDAGAGFIHFSDRNPWTEMAASLGVEARPGSWSGWNRIFAKGVPLSAEEQSRRSVASAEVGRLIDDSDVDGSDMSFAQALAHASPDARLVALQRAQMAMGEEPDRLSVAEWQTLWGGSNLVVPEGYGTLAVKAAEGLPIRLSTPVTAIHWDGPGVRVETGSGALTARAVVVTVPVGVLKKGSIRFSPRLPAFTQKALDGLAMGALTKIGLAIEPKLFGHEEGGFSDITDGSAMTVQMRPFGRPVIICNLGGDRARALCEAGEAAAVDHAVERVVAALGADARKGLGAGKLAGWWTDPWSLGGYSVAKPGRFAERDNLSRPVGGRIWFAGEANAGPASVTAGGAALAAQAAVREIAARIKA